MRGDGANIQRLLLGVFQLLAGVAEQRRYASSRLRARDEDGFVRQTWMCGILRQIPQFTQVITV